MRTILAATAIALIGALASPALAQERSPEAEAAFQRGVLAYDEQRYREAAFIWTPLAEAGDVDALQNLAQMHRLGLGVERSEAKGFALYRQAADKGAADAQVNVAFLMLTGKGTGKDPEGAARWFAKAADQGNAIAQFNLGLMHENGIGVERDLDYAIELYRQSAARGQQRAQIRLDAMEAEAAERPEPPATPRPRPDKAEIAQGVEAQGEALSPEDTPLEFEGGARAQAPARDAPARTALPAYKPAAAKAPEVPGTLLAKAEPSGAPETLTDETPGARAPAEGSSAERAKAAAALYASGAYEEAAALAAPLAADGMPAAQFLMGRMHNRGEGVPLDRVRAYALWLQAARAGSSRAATALANLSTRLTPDEIAAGREAAQREAAARQ